MKHKFKIAKEHWHAFSIESIISELITTENGLSQKEVDKRLLFYGENKLPEGKKITLIQIILHQLLNPLIFILIIGVVAAQGIHILCMQIPFMQNILRIEPITFNEWLYILALAAPIILVMEVFKLLNKQKAG